jgi:4-diphosphocytidyl-2-C-methyl-D-erythritol kinase
MYCERQAGCVVVRAPAKINLFLEVLAKRADGYHEIATLMVAINLFDTLEMKALPAGKIELTCDEPALSTGPDNLVQKAAHALCETAGYSGGAAIRLEKRIPMAAGLGGGSSDAAAALMGLNDLWKLGLSATQLSSIGSRLGSDVPFFLTADAAWCTGRGEHVVPVTVGKPIWLVLVCPASGCSTAEVYRRVHMSAHPDDGSGMLEALRAGNVEEMGKRLHNRLEEAASTVTQDVRFWKERLALLNPAGAVMTGSGSTVYALCRDEAEAKRIAQQVVHGREEGVRPRVYVVESCT